MTYLLLFHLCLPSSLLCHFGCKPGGLPGLVDCGRSGCQFWPGLALAGYVHSLQLRVLVPACVQGLQVSLVQGPTHHRILGPLCGVSKLKSCRPMEVVPFESWEAGTCPSRMGSGSVTNSSCPPLLQCRGVAGVSSGCEIQGKQLVSPGPLGLPWCFDVECLCGGMVTVPLPAAASGLRACTRRHMGVHVP